MPSDGKISFSFPDDELHIDQGSHTHAAAKKKVIAKSRPVAKSPSKIVKASSIKGEEIGQWTSKDLKDDWAELDIDVSTHISKNGDYEFAFIFTKGMDGLNLKSASLYEGTKKISEDKE